MSHLIRSRKAMTTATLSISSPPTSSATATAEMNPRLVNLVGPRVSQAPVSSTSLVALPVSAKHAHRHPRMPDTTSASTTDALGSQLEKYPGTLSLVEDSEGHIDDQVSPSDTTIGIGLHQRRSSIVHWPTTLVTSFGPIALCNESLGRRCRMKRTTISTTLTTICWRKLTGSSLNGTSSGLHQFFETIDDLHVALEEGCSKKFEDQEENWKKVTMMKKRQLIFFNCDDDGEEAVGSSRVCFLASSRLSNQIHRSPKDAGFQILTDTL
ncbi:hypothetical protein D8674_010128 [Pyrus ussuriensis x Pyrus communis]|uniref:Uncharacterized protein n=1 Tax=Pyrus ussuriensis x Pyrus communis TaxID=2448454 RepID=A0A5N5FA67_9ROSA|nr:hypothetical protein D8674_010128 [Pyrus ussuriensis x Pyrus communis]